LSLSLYLAKCLFVFISLFGQVFVCLYLFIWPSVCLSKLIEVPSVLVIRW